MLETRCHCYLDWVSVIVADVQVIEKCLQMIHLHSSIKILLNKQPNFILLWINKPSIIYVSVGFLNVILIVINYHNQKYVVSRLLKTIIRDSIRQNLWFTLTLFCPVLVNQLKLNNCSWTRVNFIFSSLLSTIFTKFFFTKNMSHCRI